MSYKGKMLLFDLEGQLLSVAVYLRVIHLKICPYTGLDKTLELQEVEATRFQENRHKEIVRQSALRIGLFPPLRPFAGNISGTHFTYRP